MEPGTLEPESPGLARTIGCHVWGKGAEGLKLIPAPTYLSRGARSSTNDVDGPILGIGSSCFVFPSRIYATR